MQRKCTCGQHTIAGGECAGCRRKRLGLQRQAVSQAEPTTVPPIVHEVLRSPGQPLDSATRAFMEPRFGHDFSGVRVHTDGKAAKSARAVNALAYTVGRDVVFGTGRYVPGTKVGKRLLVHELTHVVQQGGSNNSRTKLEIGSTNDRFEEEASRAANVVIGEAKNVKEPITPFANVLHSSVRLQPLGDNPDCTDEQADTIHQSIFNARGWLNKAISQLEEDPLSERVLNALRRNFGSTYGVAANASLIRNRLIAARSAIGTIPFSCATEPDDDLCAADHCGWAAAGSREATICTNVTLAGDTTWQFQAGCALHETFHATFSGMTAEHDSYSGWHGHSESTEGYPGEGISPLLNADSYTTLVMDLS